MTKTRLLAGLCLLLGALALFVPLGLSQTNGAAPITTTSPAFQALNLIASDTADLQLSATQPVPSRALYVGGAGNLNVIMTGDNSVPTTESNNTAANAATVPLTNGATLPPKGYYTIYGDGTNTGEVVYGTIASNTLTIVTGGGSGGNTTQFAHLGGATSVMSCAMFFSANAGSILPTRVRRLNATGTTATNVVDLY